MRKRAAMIIAGIIVAFGASISVYADYPASFWSANNKYEAAIESGNNADIIKYGEEIIDIVSSYADSDDIMVTRYKRVGLAYADLGDYDGAARTFSALYDYASKYEKHWEYAKTAKTRLNQYTSQIAMYTDNGGSSYYGAKNEKENGVLFGTCCDGASRSEIKNESMTLIYHELGKELGDYNANEFVKAASKGLAVEYALNCPQEGADIRNIKSFNLALKRISDFIGKYPEMPVYLRFAAEFDIWEDETDAQSFKEAFRYVSNYFKARNSNVAMVWSPNQASKWYIDIDEYYPGDEYVDWVGMSLYAQKYFLGDEDSGEDNEIIFKTGVNSDPVIAVRDIVEKYGNRKPIMISEFGCGHKLVKRGEDTIEFGMRRLREYLNYLPMVYPQIKLMAYFDRYIEAKNEKNDYRLSENNDMKNEFVKLTAGQRFIHGKYSDSTSYCYRKIGGGTSVNGIFPVSCYAHKYNAEIKSVTYYIDGKYAGMAREIPYTAYINASEYAGGHTLKANAEFTDGTTLATESQINIVKSNNDVNVRISGSRISFDQNPVIYNDRTMVPMRKIFEELGADVSWDGATGTASGKRGDRTVRVSVGSNEMYVNKKKITLDTPPIILSDRTLVPVRAVAEGMGCDVDWIPSSSTVTVEPKVFEWSDWDTRLPGDVDDDLFYIEEKTQTRGRTREKEYYTLDYESSWDNYVKTNTSYGDWSGWSRDYISSSDLREVQTRTASEPMKYHYAHYCTGNISDADNRYRTSSGWWHNECEYHDLGWFDYQLPLLGDDNYSYVQYDYEGNKLLCSNGCYRWYLIETDGGDYTEYRSRPIYREYVYWKWGEWSDWSRWEDGRTLIRYDDEDYEERTVYRYKEK